MLYCNLPLVTINSTSRKPSMKVRNLTYVNHIIISASASSVHHQRIMSASWAHHHYIISTSSAHHQHIISTSSAHHHFIIDHQGIISVSSLLHHQCIISTSLAHHQRIISAGQGITFIPRVLHCLLCLVEWWFLLHICGQMNLKAFGPAPPPPPPQKCALLRKACKPIYWMVECRMRPA